MVLIFNLPLLKFCKLVHEPSNYKFIKFIYETFSKVIQNIKVIIKLFAFLNWPEIYILKYKMCVVSQK